MPSTCTVYLASGICFESLETRVSFYLVYLTMALALKFLLLFLFFFTDERLCFIPVRLSVCLEDNCGQGTIS